MAAQRSDTRNAIHLPEGVRLSGRDIVGQAGEAKTAQIFLIFLDAV
jgi:hypothetical protein